MEMCKYILQILQVQPIVVFSWGFNNPKRLPEDKGLSFHVNGFKYTGEVKVIYNDAMDLFEVHLTDGRIEDMIFCDNLVNVIDGLVERTDNYKATVENEYRIHGN